MSSIGHRRFLFLNLIALSALSICGVQNAFAQEIQPVSPPANSATPNNPANLAKPLNPQLERQKMLKAHALDAIGAEVDARSNDYLGGAQTQAARMQYSSEAAISQLHQQNQNTLETMRDAKRYIRDFNGGVQIVSKYTENEINAAAENYRLQEDAFAQNAQARISGVQIEAARRAKLFNDERKNLESQFTNANVGTARLTPLGTNLYVRNYELAGGADQSDPYSNRQTSKIPGASGGNISKPGSLPPISNARAPSNQTTMQKTATTPVPMQAKAMTLNEVIGDGQALPGTRAVRATVKGTLIH